MRIGILAVQGAFKEHANILEKLSVESFEIRKRQDIERDCDGIILPGGESTVMGKLIKELEIFDVLKEKIENKIPVFGTCAGMILLASQIEDSKTVHFGTLPVIVKRNAYGRQLGSFRTEQKMENIGVIPMEFIRAPYVKEVKDGVKVLAAVERHIVAVQYENQLATAFHPELTGNTSVHEYFLEIIKKRNKFINKI